MNIDVDRDHQIHEKLKWMRTLVVGDYVCDCRFEHKRIVVINEVWLPKISTLFNSIVPLWLPSHVFSWIYDIHDWICRLVGCVELFDKDLVLEDGAECSAMHCCNPIDHEWKHPCWCKLKIMRHQNCVCGTIKE